MAIGTADRDLLITSIFEMVGEDYQSAARILVKLELRFPLVTWRSRAVTLARTWPAYQQSGLSIDWWTSEIARLADAYK